ncbi:MAG: type 2 isopentenyl-diphosphate Delta-isomerase [Pantoea sp.]|uniref:Isopentenyl-diphosphate delta-isomerase n=1 Tax=Pantoea piersonii TaxID=2364647 RepID=A0AAJ5UBX3_9GAMM|nr:type 2 isopentenyl-diphosphate Delta-isomerase [Pantoea piersonii]MDU6432996.1 type 2 isopentenyl-diphosphate Delta-isomerase [Pantoea sp.]WBG93007.1 type 2 isopentenyl-diphosphate Delta-isomerase [Pantoea piersonii]
MKDTDLTKRKNDHLDIVLRNTTPAPGSFARWHFTHCALPELHLDQIDLRTRLFNRSMQAPFLISSMTGGATRARAINHHLAEAAQTLGLALGVGSQRVALESENNFGLTRDLRRIAPDIPLLANLGAAQILGEQGRRRALNAVSMIEADALIVHLNPLQEALQRGGDRDWRGVLEAIAQLVKSLPVPVVVKEVGAGISPQVAQRLAEAGVSMIDVAGAGGTSWAAVEGERASNAQQRAVAMAFADWGIPTDEALRAVRDRLPAMPLIASGGIRDGIDAAKALRLGADIVGQAAAVLSSALHSADAVITHFQTLIEQLRVVCFCTGSANLRELRLAPLQRSGERQ